MRRPLATLCLVLLAFLAAASRITAQEAASEADRALLAAAAANFEAASSWRADFALALQLDGDLALPGLRLAAEMDVLAGDGSLIFSDDGRAFALDVSLEIPLLQFLPEARGDGLELQLVYQEGELHIALDDGTESFHEMLPLDVAEIIAMGAEWSEEATEFEAALTALSEEHSELWRLPDAAGLTVLQSELDVRALALDPALAPLLIDMLQQLEGSMSESAPWSDASRGSGPDTDGFTELTTARDMAQLFVEEATVRTTYSLDAAGEELRGLALEAELIINLEALALLGDVGPLSDLEGGELRIVMSAEATMSGYGEAFPLPSVRQSRPR